MTDLSKLAKLTDRIHQFATHLEKTKEFSVHQRINSFYYMQKAAELIVLKEQLDEIHRRHILLMRRADEEYKNVLNQWRQDMRWLYKRNK